MGNWEISVWIGGKSFSTALHLCLAISFLWLDLRQVD